MLTRFHVFFDMEKARLTVAWRLGVMKAKATEPISMIVSARR
jgi:hypothetical protein